MSCAEKLAKARAENERLLKRIEILERAVSGFMWIDDNRHNYGTPLWLEFFDAAMMDARVAMPLAD